MAKGIASVNRGWLCCLRLCWLAAATATSALDSSNPYLEGCLRSKIPEWTKQRVCNSQDPPHLRSIICLEPPPLDYLEIRIASGNWISATYLGWLMQIILSEMLGVPSTVEAGYGTSRNFYDYDARVDYDHNYKLGFLSVPAELEDGDCRQLQGTSGEDYQPCAHVIPEYWGASDAEALEAIYEKKVEPPQGLGVFGREAWFVTKFTADQDPTLDSYHGLQGEKNRRKLAETFKWPTTWRQYCEEVSVDNCTTPDDTAQRFPTEEGEMEKMFSEHLYRGHFRYTDKNNCTKNPTTCRGHAADYPCEWTSNMESNLYHLNIALESKNGPGGENKGYTGKQLEEMWHAANATKSNLMMAWWTPEPLYQQYLGTEAEMQFVQLKPVTMVCANARRTHIQEDCGANFSSRVGPPESACESPTEPQAVMTTGTLNDLVNSPDIPEAARSPAYDAIKLFRFSEPQLGELFDLAQSEPTPRDAVCKWAVDNMDFLDTLVPASYPRVARDEPFSSFGYAMIALASFTTLLILATAVLIYANRKKRAIEFAQVDFLGMLLVGSFFVCIGSIFSSVPATDGTCITKIWFVYIGYTLELIPLMIKVAAIIRMMEAAKKMRRVTMARGDLYRAVVGVTIAVVIYLAFWTAFDPPKRTSEYTLTDSITDTGEHVVGVSFHCSPESDVWAYVAVGWNAVLLLGASVLAFQTRNIIGAFNESRTLAFLIYSHLVFVVLRCGSFLLSGYLNGATLENLRSLIYSVDQIAMVFIYFVPKIVAKDEGYDLRSSRGSRPSYGISGLNFSGGSNNQLGTPFGGDINPSKPLQNGGEAIQEASPMKASEIPPNDYVNQKHSGVYQKQEEGPESPVPSQKDTETNIDTSVNQ